jgi:F-type H+-transporting ATPase subunit a
VVGLPVGGKQQIVEGSDGAVNITPDQHVFWRHGWLNINETIVVTWLMMLGMAVAAKLVTRRLSTEGPVSRWQATLEIIVTLITSQLEAVGLNQARKYLPFLGTLFLFVAISCLGTAIPGFRPPTSSLSTTAALAGCVFVSVPLFGIADQGVWGYLKTYTQPTIIMLPFNIIGEFSRTLALAMRLFGNMMSGTLIIAILITITPLLFPVVMTALGLLTGMVQAYIFFILAAVYVAAATRPPTRDTPHG